MLRELFICACLPLLRWPVTTTVAFWATVFLALNS